MSDQRLSSEKLAERWDISPHALERWRSEGIGPRYLKFRGHVRYRLCDVEAYENSVVRQGTRLSATGEIA